jgi:hypothetical protein
MSPTKHQAHLLRKANAVFPGNQSAFPATISRVEIGRRRDSLQIADI